MLFLINGKNKIRMGCRKGYAKSRKARYFICRCPICFFRIIAKDESHSQSEERFYCFGKVDGGILTVRFTYRTSVIRIIGAGYWRKGKAIYERENQIHK